MLAIFSGPSGAGKNTLINLLIGGRPDKYALLPTFTTRAPRAGEREGYPYFFVSEKIFLEMAERGEFFEHENIHGNLYGVNKRVLKEYLSKNKILLKDIDVRGAANLVRKLSAELKIVTLFITPSNPDDLRKRLARRGESETEIQKRLNRTELEQSYAATYDRIIYNDKLSDALREVKSVLESI